jgi:ATP-dependent RNA circularization protein (DNA/RNA ligase family)
MTDAFYKFPHTPHLLWLGEGKPRDDKVLSPAEIKGFLSGDIVAEEKMDGANLGLSVGPDGRLRAQSRGNYLNSTHAHAQWKPLWPWLARRENAMTKALKGGLMLFGEWCYALHTVPYVALPDWFLAFDVFEPGTGIFWSTTRRNSLLDGIGIFPVSTVTQGRLSLNQLPKLLRKSAFGDAQMEGIYLRRETSQRLLTRAKVVGTAFKQQVEEHWTRRPLVQNRLAVPMRPNRPVQLRTAGPVSARTPPAQA